MVVLVLVVLAVVVFAVVAFVVSVSSPRAPPAQSYLFAGVIYTIAISPNM